MPMPTDVKHDRALMGGINYYRSFFPDLSKSPINSLLRKGAKFAFTPAMEKLVQRWLEFLTAFDYTIEYRKGSANGNADFLSRLPESATGHDRSGSTSLNPVEDGGVYLIRACGLNAPSSPIPGVGLGGLVPRPESAWVGSLSPQPIFAIFAHTGHVRGLTTFLLPRGDSSLVFQHPSPSSIAAPVAGGLCLSPTTISLRSLPYPPRSARAPQKPRLPRRPSPSRLLQGVLHRGLTRSRPRARPCPPLPRLALRRPRR